MKAWRLATGILLIGLVLWPALPVGAQGPSQVWVDDDYCAKCANGGRRWGVDAFATVSAGVRAVAPRGVVHVLPGRYREEVRIERPCRVVGVGPGSVVLSPRSGDVTLTVAANDVTVQGLEVIGGRQAAILILGPDFQLQPIERVAIRQNVVRGGHFGIAANIDAAWNYGALPASGVELSDNQVSGCTRSLYVYNARAEISGNRVSGMMPEGIGIYSSQDSVSRIRDNTVHVDAPNGRAVYILDNTGTLVDGNVLTGVTDVLTPTTAVALYGYTDLVLSNNVVHGFYWGTNAYTGGTARIEANTFQNTASWALNLGTVITTTQVAILDNVVSGSYWGLRLDDDGGYGLQADMRGNAFTNNIVGVRLGPALQRGQVRLYGNTICGNLVAGLRNESDAPVDAADNWWGANDGPRPFGSGDRVEGLGEILLDPWVRLTAATRAVSGGVAIKVRLGSDRYPVPGRGLTFTTDWGTFAKTSSVGRTALTDAQGEAEALLSLERGEAANVTIRSCCGSSMTLSVRR